eukprot:10235127-Alexandrium_andersonii.AAC.1
MNRCSLLLSSLASSGSEIDQGIARPRSQISRVCFSAQAPGELERSRAAPEGPHQRVLSGSSGFQR